VVPIETVLKHGYVNVTVAGFPNVAGYGRVPDFTYADRPSSDSETSVATGCGNMMVTFQGELSTANTQLLSQTSEP
jgi:hypothetical protein